MALGHEGLNNLLAAYEDKTITSVCTFAYCAGPGETPILFQGKTDGKLVQARGPSNFGKRIGNCLPFHLFSLSLSFEKEEGRRKISGKGAKGVLCANLVVVLHRLGPLF